MENQKSPNRSEALETHNDPEINRENQDLDYPGYPHYPAGQDVGGGNSNAEKIEVDLDNFSNATRNTNRANLPPQNSSESISRIGYNDMEDVLPSDSNDPDQADILDPNADVTDEDFRLLGDVDQDPDDGEDEAPGNNLFLDDTDFDGDPLNESSGRRSGSGRDLDVPDDELDNAGSSMEQEDEENDYYDLKGDVAEDLEDKESRNLF